MKFKAVSNPILTAFLSLVWITGVEPAHPYEDWHLMVYEMTEWMIDSMEFPIVIDYSV